MWVHPFSQYISKFSGRAYIRRRILTKPGYLCGPTMQLFPPGATWVVPIYLNLHGTYCYLGYELAFREVRGERASGQEPLAAIRAWAHAAWERWKYYFVDND